MQRFANLRWGAKEWNKARGLITVSNQNATNFLSAALTGAEGAAESSDEGATTDAEGERERAQAF